ncbi:tail fiber protein [Clostridium tagluense]|uniref:tail fiber protein n=1 Tax=Clostridium tagluense TaxID=360422 RepID=UPI001CF55043|nr:tail fiber protein [Clostridium tagluense]MCB2300942.1 tail fiber protein [Clostridium tagluense]
MIKTPIYGLNQPQGNDTVDIGALNENTKKIDDILNLKIDNSKKSDSINSDSSDTIATSKAVKYAYDRGVEALGKVNSNDTQLAKKVELYIAETLPIIADRKANTLYFKATNTLNTDISNNLKVSPTMGIKVI